MKRFNFNEIGAMVAIMPKLAIIIGTNLKKFREAEGLTQEQLARLTKNKKVSEVTINRIEGGVQTPRAKTIEELARILNKNPEDFLSMEEPKASLPQQNISNNDSLTQPLLDRVEILSKKLGDVEKQNEELQKYIKQLEAKLGIKS